MVAQCCNRALMHVYVGKPKGVFLRAKWIGPDAEHIAYLLAWAMQMKLGLEEMLAKPFYRAVLEEGLRMALTHTW